MNAFARVRVLVAEQGYSLARARGTIAILIVTLGLPVAGNSLNHQCVDDC